MLKKKTAPDKVTIDKDEEAAKKRKQMTGKANQQQSGKGALGKKKAQQNRRGLRFVARQKTSRSRPHVGA